MFRYHPLNCGRVNCGRVNLKKWLGDGYKNLQMKMFELYIHFEITFTFLLIELPGIVRSSSSFFQKGENFPVCLFLVIGTEGRGPKFLYVRMRE